MKKLFILPFCYIVLCVVFAFATKKSEPVLSVELPPSDWQTVFQVIDQSTAPHSTVTAVQTALSAQLQRQLEAIKQKAAADSSRKK